MAHTLHQMEMARVRFLVSAYLRIRLNKIEKHVFHIMDEVKAAQESGQTYRKVCILGTLDTVGCTKSPYQFIYFECTPF